MPTLTTLTRVQQDQLVDDIRNASGVDRSVALKILSRVIEPALERHMATALRPLLNLFTELSDTEGYGHNGHPSSEGEPECPGCWLDTIHLALERSLS